MPNDANVIGRRVAFYRNQRGWSQNVLVTELHLLGNINMTRDILANIENLRCVATCKQIEFIAEALGVTEQDLFPKKRHFVGRDVGMNLRIFTRQRRKPPPRRKLSRSCLMNPTTQHLFMAVRRNQQDFDQQLDLFSTRRPTHDYLDPIRPDGRETLARASLRKWCANWSGRDSCTKCFWKPRRRRRTKWRRSASN